MRVVCPHCGRKGSLPDGQPLPPKARCPGCKQAFEPKAAAADYGLTGTGPLPASEIERVTGTPVGWRHAPPAVPAPPPVLVPTPVESAVPARACDFCGEAIQPAAKKCRHCGELLDPVLRAAAEAGRAHAARPAPGAPVTVHNTVVTSATAAASAIATVKGRRASGCGGCLLILVGLTGACMLLAVVGGNPRPTPVEPAPPAEIVTPDNKSDSGVPAEPEAAPAPPPKRAGPDVTALMKMAGALESRNPRAALDYYRRVVSDYPGSPQAQEAETRIGALKGK